MNSNFSNYSAQCTLRSDIHQRKSISRTKSHNGNQWSSRILLKFGRTHEKKCRIWLRKIHNQPIYPIQIIRPRYNLFYTKMSLLILLDSFLSKLFSQLKLLSSTHFRSGPSPNEHPLILMIPRSPKTLPIKINSWNDFLPQWVA